MSTPLNPYAPPTARVDDVADAAPLEAESIRRANLTHETSLRGVGSLYYLGGIFLAIGGIFSASTSGAEELSSTVNALIACIVLAMAGGFFAIGYGLRRLRAWVRIPAILMSVVGLLGFPIGTLINGYIIWLIVSKKGQLVLSDEYAAVVAATPQIKYRTSIIVWIFLGLGLALFLGLALIIVFPR